MGTQDVRRVRPLTPDTDWHVLHGHKLIDALGAHVQAEQILAALIQGERIRDDLATKLEEIEALVKTQVFNELFEDLSGELDGTLANFVHTMNGVYDALDDAGVPAKGKN